MKVFFTGNISKLDTYKDNFLAINAAIKELGHSLTRDWVDDAVKDLKQGKKHHTDATYEDIVKAVEHSEVVVVEGTIGSLGVGHIVTLALQREKPTLLLQFSPDKQEKFFLNEFIENSKPSLVMNADYDLQNVESVLENFFTLYKDGGKFRFNLLLDSDVRDYLNWAAKYTGKTKSAIIRDLVRDDSLKNKKYQARKKREQGTEEEDIAATESAPLPLGV